MPGRGNEVKQFLLNGKRAKTPALKWGESALLNLANTKIAGQPPTRLLAYSHTCLLLPMLQSVAKFISILFHPLLVLTYMLILLLLVNPYQFGSYSIVEQWKLVLLVFLSTFVMPMFAVVLMRTLNMVKTIELHDRQDRIIPYIITGVFYLWMFINFKHNQLIPKPLTITMLGATIALFIAFFFNNFSKISAHAVGMGGLVGMAVLNSLFFNFDTFTLNLGVGAFEVSTNFVVMATLL
ncbi:MAG: hypothetical protein AAB316_20545, partial [Bacteroidota bacterium]